MATAKDLKCTATGECHDLALHWNWTPVYVTLREGGGREREREREGGREGGREGERERGREEGRERERVREERPYSGCKMACVENIIMEFNVVKPS